MSEEIGHAKAIGIIVAVCLAAACVLGVNLLLVLVVVNEAGWLKNFGALISVVCIGALLAFAQFTFVGRFLRTRHPAGTQAVVDYSLQHKGTVIMIGLAMLILLRVVLGACVE